MLPSPPRGGTLLFLVRCGKQRRANSCHIDRSGAPVVWGGVTSPVRPLSAGPAAAFHGKLLEIPAGTRDNEQQAERRFHGKLRSSAAEVSSESKAGERERRGRCGPCSRAALTRQRSLGRIPDPVRHVAAGDRSKVSRETRLWRCQYAVRPRDIGPWDGRAETIPRRTAALTAARAPCTHS